MCLLNSLHTSNFKRSVAFALQIDQTRLGGFEGTCAAISAMFALGVCFSNSQALNVPACTQKNQNYDPERA